LDTIGNWAFSNCPKLLSINIGQIGSFGEGVFENTPIGFPHESKTIGDQEQLMELALIYLRGDGVLMNRSRTLDLCKRILRIWSPEIVENNFANVISEGTKSELEGACIWTLI